MTLSRCEKCGSLNVEMYRSPTTDLYRAECEDCGQCTCFGRSSAEVIREWNENQDKLVELKSARRKREYLGE